MLVFVSIYYFPLLTFNQVQYFLSICNSERIPGFLNVTFQQDNRWTFFFF